MYILELQITIVYYSDCYQLYDNSAIGILLIPNEIGENYLLK